MTNEEVFSRVTDTFRDVFDDDDILLRRETTADDIEDWDSIAHISLIVALEKEFSIKFDLVELKPLKNVGELLDLIQSKAGN
jgi:acyl carrier protein